MQMKSAEIVSEDELIILEKFNCREQLSFGIMYERIFDAIYHFAKKTLLETTISPEGVIHDIFLSIWEHRSLRFETVEHLKGYLYLSIRNYLKNWIIKQSRKNKYEHYVKCDDDYFESQIIETEVISEIAYAIELLPAESAKVLRLTIEGWDIKEIAKQLGKSQSTIYNQRTSALRSLKKKMSDKSFEFILSLINVI